MSNTLILSQRVPGGVWPAAVRAVVTCGSSTGVFKDGRPRAIIQWAARVNDTAPHRLYAISQYVTLDPSVITYDGVGSVCTALFSKVPEHLTADVLLGRSCMITVGLNGWEKNRVIGHAAIPPGIPPVILPPELCAHGNIWEMDSAVFIKLDLPPTMRQARVTIAGERGICSRG